MTDTPAAITLRNVSRAFANVAAVTSVSLEIKPGEVACLVGQSGCGKSTLLRLIAGVDQADDGELELHGRLMFGPGTFVEPEDRNVGFMFQDYALFPHLTARQNVLFGLKRLSGRDAERRADETIERLNLQHLSSKHPHMLSGGEQQRVALARALAPQPDVLLMDEPYSNLDRRLRDDIRTETTRLLRELATTVIVVTHDPEEALALGDRVVLMRDGHIVQQGEGEDLYLRPQSPYAAEFFCSFNKIPGRAGTGGIDTPLGRFAALSDMPADTATTVFIRPQDIVLDLDPGGVQATILERTLLGEIEELQLAVAGVAAPLRMRSTRASGHDVGDVVSVSADASRILAFPA